MASRLFKILYISSTFTNITIPFSWINFAVLWNSWFCKIFFKIHWNNVFFFFQLCFLKFETQNFLLLFSFLCFEWSTYILHSKIRIFVIFCYLLHQCARELIDWLIWFIHQFWSVHLNKHQSVEILLTACNYYQLWCKYPPKNVQKCFTLSSYLVKINGLEIIWSSFLLLILIKHTTRASYKFIYD